MLMWFGPSTYLILYFAGGVFPFALPTAMFFAALGRISERQRWPYWPARALFVTLGIAPGVLLGPYWEWGFAIPLCAVGGFAAWGATGRYRTEA